MSEQTIKNMCELDEIAEKAGGFVAPFGDNKTSYDYRAMLAYCKEKGVEPLDLTVREYNSFIIR